MKKHLKYPIIGVIIVFLSFVTYIASGLYGNFIYLSDFEKQKLDNYNTNYEQTYSKIQTPENLFALFKQRMLNKDKEGVKVMTIPAFFSLPKEMKDKDFEEFYDFYKEFTFEKAEFEVKFDTANYFEIKNLSQNPESKYKIYFEKQNMQSLSHKINQFPIKSYYVMEARISK